MACRFCRPDIFPTGPRQGEHHFAVRFGDAFLPIWVYLDGQEVRDCTEAIAGAHGLVVVDTLAVIPCDCGSGEPCQRVERGRVVVTSTPPLDTHTYTC